MESFAGDYLREDHHKRKYLVLWDICCRCSICAVPKKLSDNLNVKDINMRPDSGDARL